VRLFEGAWTAPVVAAGEGDFDLVVSNPPYIASAEIDALAPEVSEHEPRRALDGGADGLDAVRAILAEAPDLMRPDGWLLVEIGADRQAGAKALADAEALLDRVQVFRDHAGRPRVLAARRRPDAPQASRASEGTDSAPGRV